MKDYEAGENQSWSSCEPWSTRPSLPSLLPTGTWAGLSHNCSVSSEPLHSQLLTTQLLPNSRSSFPAGQLYGLEKFWAFLKYSKAKNLDIDPKLQEYLGKFRRLEDFRVDVSESLSFSPWWSWKETRTKARTAWVLAQPCH